MSEEVGEYLIHTVNSGERWDQIAYKYYGSALMYENIIRANPSVPIWASLPEGTRLKIPVLNADEVEAETGGQPPWR